MTPKDGTFSRELTLNDVVYLGENLPMVLFSNIDELAALIDSEVLPADDENLNEFVDVFAEVMDAINSPSGNLFANKMTVRDNHGRLVYSVFPRDLHTVIRRFIYHKDDCYFIDILVAEKLTTSENPYIEGLAVAKRLGWRSLDYKGLPIITAMKIYPEIDDKTGKPYIAGQFLTRKGVLKAAGTTDDIDYFIEYDNEPPNFYDLMDEIGRLNVGQDSMIVGNSNQGECLTNTYRHPNLRKSALGWFVQTARKNDQVMRYEIKPAKAGDPDWIRLYERHYDEKGNLISDWEPFGKPDTESEYPTQT